MPLSDSEHPALMPPLRPTPWTRRGESLRRPILWWVAFVAWNAALFWLSSISGDRLPALMPMIPQFDKVEHAGFYAVGFGLFTVALGLTQSRAAAGSGRRRRGLVGLAILMAAICGGLDEWHQTFTPHRSGLDLGDWTADVVGGTLGALGALAAVWLLGIRINKPRPAANDAPLGVEGGSSPV